MKLPDFKSPSGDSSPKSANFGLSKWIFYVKNYLSFFLQNREKLKYRFLTFLPVTWVKIELQKGTIHQMNGWNLYFLVDFYAIVENSMWGALGPRMLLSNSSNHPLIKFRIHYMYDSKTFLKRLQYFRKVIERYLQTTYLKI